MAWRSTQDIIDRFSLDAEPDDFESLDRELRHRVSQLHPDKNGGQFESNDDRLEFDEVKAARDFVNTLMNTSRDVVAIEQLPAILNALQLAQSNQPNGQDRHLRTEVRNENRQDLHSRYTAPRVGSGVFAAITGALFTFSGSLADHPVLGALESSYEVQLGLLALSGYSAIFFGLTWYFEQRAEAKVDFLLSEQGMQIVFKELVLNLRNETDSLRFSRRRVARIVSGYCGGSKSVGRLSMLFGRQGVKPSTVDRIVELHVSEWEARGAIHKVETPSVERLYDVNRQAIESEHDF
ncbi:hypothetical protein [Salinivibrio kushneri]|uniref:hypothetical protein n=1 Tax=Salinivibrio kushneri TaxID=1908198 RepID=UPI0022B4ECE8|nr:hypothetical protein [Salinivibrio kushneri]WBA13406.1 hypothetical protein O4546_13805 [Salinivibrio kushneri]